MTFNGDLERRFRPAFDNDFANFQKFCKLRTAVYPPNMPPMGMKIWENAFQMIPDISIFDVKNIKILQLLLKL